MTSVSATIMQGGSEGSAVKQLLEKTSTIGKNRKPPSQKISLEDADQDSSDPFPKGLSSKTSDEQEIVNSDCELSGDEEFDVINPLFQHAGSSRRFRAETDGSFQRSYLVQLFGSLQRLLTVPDGRITVSVINIVGLKDPNEVRVRFSLNGEVSWSNSNKRILQFSHFKDNPFDQNLSIHEINDENPSELNIEVNNYETDSFWAAAVIKDVDSTIPPVPTKFFIKLLDISQVQVGELEVVLSYYRYTMKDIAGIRWKKLIESRKSFASGLKERSRSFADSLKKVLITGLPGFQGGAASWVVLGFLCIPFIFLSVFTQMSFAMRQWFLVVPCFFYIHASFPVLAGWLFETLITVFALHGYPGRFRCGVLHFTPWIKGYALHIRITGLDLEMGNPEGFPFGAFWSCKRADICGSISFRHLLETLLLRYKKVPLKNVPDFLLLAKFEIDYIEFEDFDLHFQMYNGKFNVWEVSHLLAEYEARHVAWAKGYMKFDDPMPNELEIRIIRAKNLVKTKTSKPNRKAQLRMADAASGLLGRNAVVDAFFEEDSDEEDEEGGEVVDDINELINSHKKKYRGLGPPQFNPMDATVEPRPKQGHFDPYVVIKLRRDVQKSKTQTRTNSPMWNETFYFHVTDAATVVVVQVFNREAGKDRLIGQWIMTLKYMLSNPQYCWHEKGLEVTPDRWIRGWFPLINKNFRGVGKCGKIEMAFQWRYVPENKLKRKVEFAPLSSLAQLQENSDETRLRMGDMARVKYWLNHEPFLFDVKRVSIFRFKMYLQGRFQIKTIDLRHKTKHFKPKTDLFLPGSKGEAEKKGVDNLHFINVVRVDWLDEFRPKNGDLGITVYRLLYRFFAGIAPKVLNTASQANVGQTLGVIASSAVPQIKHGIGKELRHLFHGEISKVGPVASVSRSISKIGRSADRTMQYMHRNISQNKTNEAEFKVPVTADDEDFLIEVPKISGYLARCAVKIQSLHFDLIELEGGITDIDMEKESRRKASFRTKYFELKGSTLFYRANRNISKHNIYNVSYKIPLDQVVGAIYFLEEEELMLNMQSLGIVTRLRLTATDMDEDDDHDTFEETIGIDKWFTALQEAGVSCYTWKRAEKKTKA